MTIIQSLDEIIIDMLPHGSGINYDWHVVIKDNETILCHNCYDTMDEYGSYRETIDFTAEYNFSFYDGLLKLKLTDLDLSCDALPLDVYIKNLENDDEMENKLLSIDDDEVIDNTAHLYGLDDYLWQTLDI